MRVPDDLVEVARVVAAHGVRGWVHVRPHAPSPESLLATKDWWLVPPGAAAQGAATPSGRWMQVSAHRVATDQRMLVKWVGIDDRDAAQALRGWHIRVPRAVFPPPADDEYYWVDLIGCTVFGRLHGERLALGRVKAVFDNGAHAVLQVESEPDSPDDAAAAAHERAPDFPTRVRHWLVPFVAAHIDAVDLAGRRIESNWPADF